MIDYIKMPEPLTVLGFFYTLVALVFFIKLIKDGYLLGTMQSLKIELKNNLRNILFGLTLAILMVIFLDLGVTLLCKKYYNQNLYTVTDFICSMAEGWFVGGVLLTCYLIFLIWNKFILARLMSVSFLAAIFAGVANGILKLIFNRERPDVGMNPYHFFEFLFTQHRRLIDLTYAYNSMPSGHTITVFAAITPIFIYTKNRLFRVTLLGFGILVMYARVYTLNHWLSDVFVSAILGIAIGSVMYKNNHDLIKKS